METRRTERRYNQENFNEIENAATNSIEVTLGKGDFKRVIKRYFRPDEDRALVVADMADMAERLQAQFGPKEERP